MIPFMGDCVPGYFQCILELKDSKNKEAAKAFLSYLTGSEASEIFRSVGFTPLTN